MNMGLKELKALQKTGIKVNIATPVLDYEAIIDSWYDSLESFTPKTADYLREKQTLYYIMHQIKKERYLLIHTQKNPKHFQQSHTWTKLRLTLCFGIFCKE